MQFCINFISEILDIEIKALGSLHPSMWISLFKADLEEQMSLANRPCVSACLLLIIVI